VLELRATINENDYVRGEIIRNRVAGEVVREFTRLSSRPKFQAAAWFAFLSICGVAAVWDLSRRLAEGAGVRDLWSTPAAWFAIGLPAVMAMTALLTAIQRDFGMINQKQQEATVRKYAEIEARKRPKLLGNRVYILSDDGIAIMSDYAATKYMWRSARRIAESEKEFFVSFGTDVITIPKRDIRDETIAKLRANLERQAGFDKTPIVIEEDSESAARKDRGGKFVRNAMFGMAIAMLLYLYAASRPTPTAAPQTAYSDFIADLNAGHVRDVVIKGQLVSGQLTDGRTFETYRPDDPGLVSKLSEKGVRVIAKPEDDTAPSLSQTLSGLIPTLALFVIWAVSMHMIGSLVHGLGGQLSELGVKLSSLLERDRAPVPPPERAPLA
jgi:hypothetical protein